MEFLEGDALRKRILEDYSKHPKGWSFVVSPSPKSGFYDALMSGPNGTWVLKTDSIFRPSPIVLGSRLDLGVESKAAIPFQYGYRRLPTELILRMLGDEGPSPESRRLPSLLSVLKSEPVVPEAGRSYAEGPFVLAGPEKLDLSKSQREVDATLTSEMRRLLRTRYPAYG